MEKFSSFKIESTANQWSRERNYTCRGNLSWKINVAPLVNIQLRKNPPCFAAIFPAWPSSRFAANFRNLDRTNDHSRPTVLQPTMCYYSACQITNFWTLFCILQVYTTWRSYNQAPHKSQLVSSARNFPCNSNCRVATTQLSVRSVPQATKMRSFPRPVTPLCVVMRNSSPRSTTPQNPLKRTDLYKIFLYKWALKISLV